MKKRITNKQEGSNKMIITTFPFLRSAKRQGEEFKSAIVSYVQSDQCPQAEMKVKILAIEAKNCTVGDCIRIMMVDSMEEQAWAIAQEQKDLDCWKEKLEKSKTNNLRAKCQYHINECQHRIQMLRDVHHEEVIPYYKSWNMKQVVAIYVVCSYEIYLSPRNIIDSKTETFIIDPDRLCVIGTEPHGKLNPPRKRIKME